MAACVKILPCILISKNAHSSNFYSKTKRPTSFVQETKEKINPVLPSVYTGNNTTNVLHLKKNSNPRSYEAADLNKKLITVNLPKSIFGETRKLSETRKTETIKKTPNNEKVWQEKISESKLRSPEDKIKLQDTGRQIEPRILETSHRRQQHLQNVAERAQRHNQAEVARRKKALEMRRGECLLVKDQLSPFFTCL